jgi:XTP/dITP diphosphohydrolase
LVNAPAPGRLVLLVTTHRVAPGLLSWPAWELLRAAGQVYAGPAGSPHEPYLAEAGVTVHRLAGPGSAAPDRPGASNPAPHWVAARLLDAAAHGTVVWLAGTDGDPALGQALATLVAAAADRGDPVPAIEVIHGSYDLPGARLLDLVAVMDRLRSPGGCPWDAQQTHESLVGYLLEEAYETVESIESGNLGDLREELGDLLLQVVFHARMAEEHTSEPFSIDDVAGGIVDKLIRRHPHVFGDVDAPTAAHVEANWETIKAAEKGRSSAVEGVPMAQPALALAAKLMSRAEKAGLDVPVPPLRFPADDLGELLLAVVAEARRRGLDPEAELRAAARRYADRVRAAESGDS